MQAQRETAARAKRGRLAAADDLGALGRKYRGNGRHIVMLREKLKRRRTGLRGNERTGRGLTTIVAVPLLACGLGLTGVVAAIALLVAIDGCCAVLCRRERMLALVGMMPATAQQRMHQQCGRRQVGKQTRHSNTPVAGTCRVPSAGHRKGTLICTNLH